MAYNSIDSPHAPEVVLGQVAQTDFLEEILLPTLGAAVDTYRDVALLAHGTAEASRVASGSQVRQRIAEIIELAAIEQLLWHVVLQPEGFGDLHLNAHLSADIAEEVVAGGIDLLGLFDGAVIQPQYDIAVIAVVLEVGPGYGDGLVRVFREYRQRTSGIEADSLDQGGVDTRLVNDTLYTMAYTVPDVGGGLFLVRQKARQQKGSYLVSILDP